MFFSIEKERKISVSTILCKQKFYKVMEYIHVLCKTSVCNPGTSGSYQQFRRLMSQGLVQLEAFRHPYLLAEVRNISAVHIFP